MSQGFVEKCGSFLPEGKKSSSHKKKAQPSKKKTPVYGKSSKIGLVSWWNGQNNRAKALSVIGVCCLGLIIVVAIGGMISPDKTTTNVTTPNVTTPTVPTPLSTDNSGNATYNNSVISFHYPENLQVKNASSDPADGAIIITNDGDANNGILVTSQSESTYEDNIAPDPSWTFETYKSPEGVSYLSRE